MDHIHIYTYNNRREKGAGTAGRKIRKGLKKEEQTQWRDCEEVAAQQEDGSSRATILFDSDLKSDLGREPLFFFQLLLLLLWILIIPL